jgi:hypothetical protein
MRHASTALAVLALLLGQVGAQLHSLSHVEHDLAVVHEGSKAPPLGHSAEVCVAYHAVCSAIGHAGHWPPLPPAPPQAVALAFRLFILRAPQVQFFSRAPPAPPQS